MEEEIRKKQTKKGERRGNDGKKIEGLGEKRQEKEGREGIEEIKEKRGIKKEN